MTERILTVDEFLRETIPPLARAGHARLIKRREELQAQLRLRQTSGGGRQSGKTLLFANLRQINELIASYDAVIADARTVHR
jgi:hypothetical protein